VLDDSSSRRVNSAIEIHNNLIDETSFTFFEEVVEGLFELVELTGLLD
jgi:hypothetical protein